MYSIVEAVICLNKKKILINQVSESTDQDNRNMENAEKSGNQLPTRELGVKCVIVLDRCNSVKARKDAENP